MTEYSNPSEEASEILKASSLVFSEAQVDEAVGKLAERINTDYADKSPLVICVMNGGLIATAKIASKLTMPLQMDYIHATRYGDKTSGSELKWIAGPQTSLKGRDVILIDDILDEGITLQCLVKYCHEQGVASVNAALLVKKAHDRCVAPELGRYVGLGVPDKYVFGCGMDYKGKFRNLPAIYALNES